VEGGASRGGVECVFDFSVDFRAEEAFPRAGFILRVRAERGEDENSFFVASAEDSPKGMLNLDFFVMDAS